MTIDVIVNDTSCLIELRKGGLLTAALRLRFRFIVALPLVSAELQGFHEADWRDLRARGLEVIDFDARRVGRGVALKSQFPGLSAYNCFSLALVETTPGAILLTGDR